MNNRIRKTTVAALAALAATAGLTALASGQSGTAPEALPQGSEPVTLDPAEFTHEITNPWWPMKVGSHWVYREVGDAGERVRVDVEVLRRTYEISNGIKARVVRDVVREESPTAGRHRRPPGEPIEKTDDWYAQDAEGNVWYLGEDTAEYENGEVVSTSGSFEHGVDGAYAGVIMPADPQVGMEYRQEYYEGEAEDEGKIISLDEKVEVPTGRYYPALMTRDTVPTEPKVSEHKFYVKGIGPVLTLDISGGSGREDLVRFRERR